jgi:hypothetical protein
MNSGIPVAVDAPINVTAINERLLHFGISLNDIQRQLCQLRTHRLNCADRGRRDSTRKSQVTQTQRDNEKIEDRKRKLGSKFSAMQSHLKCSPKAELLWAADILTFRFGIEKVGRSGRRNRDALVCWYCESFPDLLNESKVLSEILTYYHKPFPVSDISPDSQRESEPLPPYESQMETMDSTASDSSFLDVDWDQNYRDWWPWINRSQIYELFVSFESLGMYRRKIPPISRYQLNDEQ